LGGWAGFVAPLTFDSADLDVAQVLERRVGRHNIKIGEAARPRQRSIRQRPSRWLSARAAVARGSPVS